MVQISGLIFYLGPPISKPLAGTQKPVAKNDGSLPRLFREALLKGQEAFTVNLQIPKSGHITALGVFCQPTPKYQGGDNSAKATLPGASQSHFIVPAGQKTAYLMSTATNEMPANVSSLTAWTDPARGITAMAMTFYPTGGKQYPPVVVGNTSVGTPYKIELRRNMAIVEIRGQLSGGRLRGLMVRTLDIIRPTPDEGQGWPNWWRTPGWNSDAPNFAYGNMYTRELLSPIFEIAGFEVAYDKDGLTEIGVMQWPTPQFFKPLDKPLPPGVAPFGLCD